MQTVIFLILGQLSNGLNNNNKCTYGWKINEREKKKKSDNWKLSKNCSSPQIGWVHFLFLICQKGLVPTFPLWGSFILPFAFLTVCSKKHFKDKGPMKWRLIMNSLPLLNVSSQPNVREYSVRGYWAVWKCQTERNRKRGHMEETKVGGGNWSINVAATQI